MSEVAKNYSDSNKPDSTGFYQMITRLNTGLEPSAVIDFGYVLESKLLRSGTSKAVIEAALRLDDKYFEVAAALPDMGISAFDFLRMHIKQPDIFAYNAADTAANIEVVVDIIQAQNRVTASQNENIETPAGAFRHLAGSMGACVLVGKSADVIEVVNDYTAAVEEGEIVHFGRVHGIQLGQSILDTPFEVIKERLDEYDARPEADRPRDRPVNFQRLARPRE